MKRYINIRTVAYTLYTVALFAVVYLMDSTPDHSVGTGDYSTWCKYLYFPVLMTYHGLMSGVILRGSRIWVPLTVTAVISLAESMLTRSNVANTVFESLNIPAPIRITCYFLIFTAVGFLVIKVCRLLYVGVRVIISNWKN